MIAEMLLADCVTRASSQIPRDAGERQIVGYGEPSIIKQDVMVGAKAKQVRQFVRAIMRPSERTDMCSLCVRPTLTFEGCPADLTPVPV